MVAKQAAASLRSEHQHLTDRKTGGGSKRRSQRKRHTSQLNPHQLKSEFHELLDYPTEGNWLSGSTTTLSEGDVSSTCPSLVETQFEERNQEEEEDSAPHQTVQIEVHQYDQQDQCDQPSDIFDEGDQDLTGLSVSRGVRRASLSRNTQISSSRVRRSVHRRKRRQSTSSSNSVGTQEQQPWLERAVDEFIKEAQVNNLNKEQVVAYMSGLLNKHINSDQQDCTNNEELFTNEEDKNNSRRKRRKASASVIAARQLEDRESEEYCTVDTLNNRNSERSSELGVPVHAFPPSLIKWPGHNNNRQKRLSEIKKQVKFLSSIIKMTIEGNQSMNSLEGATAGAKGAQFTNPAPFTEFVDMSTIPSSALANANAEDSFLPTIDQIKEFLQTNKVKEAKTLLRSAGGAVTCPTRPHLWKELCKRQTTEQFSDSFYYDTIQQIYGTTELHDCRVVLPAFVDVEHLGGSCLTSAGMAACGRIISVLAYYYPPITYAPTLHPLAAALLLYMNEADVYNSLSALVCSSKVTFVTQTKQSYEVSWKTVLTLARKHVGSCFSSLDKYGVDAKQTEVAFQSWLWWILDGIPAPHMVRVLDCFLLEGWKVLVRVALAIFQLFMRQVTKDSDTCVNLTTKGLGQSIKVFCRNLTISPAKLLKNAFGIRALSTSEIQKVMLKMEGGLKRGGGVEVDELQNTHEDMSGYNRAVSLEGLPTATAQANVQSVSHTLNVKEGSSPAPRQRALGDFPIRHLKSKVATMDELLTIWNWMPVRMTMYQPSLLYTTEEHGSSLTSFYQRVENHEPTILLVRTSCDHVFGAYCSTAWNARNRKDEFGHKQTYYGSGETFLFTLRPVPAKYQWVGITQQQQDSTLSHVKHSSELFMHGDDDMITIGGGGGQGIFLDHELQFGKSDRCDTFDNPPLCPTKDFEVKVVEVYGIDVNAA